MIALISSGESSPAVRDFGSRATHRERMEGSSVPWQTPVVAGSSSCMCSTATVRMVASSRANLFASTAAGVCALWGPLHGGANLAVIEILEEIVNKKPNQPTFRYHLGAAWLQKGDKAKAKKELETALANRPSQEELGRIRELLVKAST